MKRFLLLMLLSMSLGMGTAYALPSVQVQLADSAGNFTAVGVQELDWASSGSGVATDIGPYGTLLTVGDEFSFYYQAFLSGLTGSGGNAVNFTGTDFLNTDFEYTIVAEFKEKVIALNGTTATFTTLSGGLWYMYYDDFADSVTNDTNVLNGTGFDDGILVAYGTILSGENSNFTYVNATLGIGSSSIEGLVDFVNNQYIKEMPNEFTIFDFHFEGTQNYPAGNSNANAYFLDGDGGDDEGNFTAYTVQNDDIRLKADTSSTFSPNPIPEPSTMLLFGAGLLGLSGLTRRKIKK